MLLFTLTLAGCEKESELLLLVSTPYADTGTEIYAGDEEIVFRIETRSLESVIEKLHITSHDKTYGTEMLLDTALGVKNTRIEWRYRTRTYMDTTGVTLTFEVVEGSGATRKITATVTVKGDDTHIEPVEGIVLYSAMSGGKSAFCFKTMNTLFASAANYRQMDIYDVTNNLTGELSRNWASRTGLQFARFENFDYGQATAPDIQDAYVLSKHDNEIKGLRNGDIIVVGKGDEAWGVIQITNIYDEEGTEEDRYMFSLKAISRE